MSATQKLLRFGVFELNLDGEELRKDGIPLKLPPQPFKILTLLASRAGQLVTREDIQKQVWGEETYVDFDHGLNQCIKQIRSALNDNPDRPVYVETVPRRGYRFLAPVVSKIVPAPPPKVVESTSGIAPALAGIGGSSFEPPQLALATPPQEVRQPGSGSVVAVATAPVAETASAAPARRRIPRFTFLASGLLLAALVASWLYWGPRKASALTERDTVVLADFANSTGDPVFDDTMKQALAIQLQQSPFLNLLSDPQIAQTVSLMEQPKDVRLTPELAREVCQRTGSAATIEGSISTLGNQYVLGIKAVSCRNGDLLANEQETAKGKEQVLDTLGDAATKLRKKLGESLASVQRFNKPLEEATTSSLEALRAYSQGRKLQVEQGDTAAEPYLKRALELDPNFAVAYAALAVVYYNRGQTNLALENYKKAYGLSDRVSQKERLSIQALYYLGIGDLEKAILTYNELIQIYPQYGRAHMNLGVSYRLLGQYDKSVNETRESIRLIGDNVAGYDNLLLDYNAMGLPDKAQAAFDDARAHKLDDAFLHLFRYDAAFLRGDDAVMQQEAGWAVSKLGAEDLLLSAQSDTEAYYGRFGKARQFSQRAVESAKHAEALETAAGWKANQALREAEIGNTSQARQTAAEAISIEPGHDVRAVAALAFARVGDAERAQKLVDQLNHDFPLDTIMQGYSLPTIRAAIELKKNNPDKAIEELQAATPYEMGGESFSWLYPAYIRGEAYLQAGQGRQAVAEFQKILNHPGIMLNFVTGALAHLQMARAHALSGDKEAARQSYQAFLDLWKNADPDLQILLAAQAEYEKLK